MVANSSEKIPVNGVSVSRDTLTVPPCLVAFFGVAVGKFFLVFTLVLPLLLHATKASAAAVTTPIVITNYTLLIQIIS
ncbi:hypothetical protein FC77_GL000998 [Lactobacillus acetotolerans DSM 20749 = JCM 3825]|nr:hypothetical protein FC77_GL000998 [Lactobacillus acetotolerans DSM 20749 = JCM 3825]GGV09260.1 hypothetical protein GCM10011628_03150 [Lactobacillus acetotolerans DSM 20749 = JCM 3825]